MVPHQPPGIHGLPKTGLSSFDSKRTQSVLIYNLTFVCGKKKMKVHKLVLLAKEKLVLGKLQVNLIAALDTFSHLAFYSAFKMTI